MPKDTKTLGNSKARACESLGFVHKKGCARVLTQPHLFLLYTARFIFYDYNLKVLGVIRTLIEVQEKIKSHPDLKKRYFLKPDEVILLADGTKIVVNNQWGTLFPRFLEAAKKLYQVTNDSESNTPISRLKITFGNGKVIQEICLEKYFFMKSTYITLNSKIHPIKKI